MPRPEALDGPAGLRILMVTPRFHPEVGGVERHVAEVAARVAAAGAEVAVLTTDAIGGLAPREARDGVEVLRVPAWPRGGDLHVAPGLRAVLRAGRWDVVHVQSYHTFVAPLAMAAAARARLPYLLTFHGGGHSSPVRARLRTRQRAVLRPLLARARRLVAVAAFEVEEYGRELRLAPARFALIPNGIDLPAAAPAAAGGDDVVIASVGRLERYKGHHRAIAALPYVLEREPRARLWIAGTGPYEGELRRRAAALGVADRVEIRAIPSGEPEAMAARLGAAAVAVLLSEFETHPIAALEARSLGRPLVVADTSGLRELVRSGQATAVPLDAPPRAVAEAIVREIVAPTPRPPLETFTWDDCARELGALYAAVAREGACAS